MGAINEVKEVEFKHLFYSNYGSGATDILQGDILECIDLYFNLVKEVEIKKLWDLYRAQFPHFTKDDYISFEDYKNSILYPSKNDSSENVVSDSRTDEELESFADSIMFGGTLKAREENIKSRR